MKKKLISTALLAIAFMHSLAYATNWTYIETGVNTEDYLNVDSIIKKNEKVRFWVASVFHKDSYLPQFDNKSDVKLSWTEVECNKPLIRKHEDLYYLNGKSIGVKRDYVNEEKLENFLYSEFELIKLVCNADELEARKKRLIVNFSNPKEMKDKVRQVLAYMKSLEEQTTQEKAKARGNPF